MTYDELYDYAKSRFPLQMGSYCYSVALNTFLLYAVAPNGYVPKLKPAKMANEEPGVSIIYDLKLTPQGILPISPSGEVMSDFSYCYALPFSMLQDEDKIKEHLTYLSMRYKKLRSELKKNELNEDFI